MVCVEIMPCLALRAPPDHPVRALLLQSNIVQKMIEYPELIYTRVGAISYFRDFEAHLFIQAVGTHKDQLLLTNFFAQTDRFRSPGLGSFGLIVLEAEFLRSAN